MTSGKIPASAQRAARSGARDQLSNSESGVRAISVGDELDRVFETLESGAPPRGLFAADDPGAEAENRALLHQLAREQLHALRQRIEELGVASAQIEALRLLFDSLGALLEALQPSSERSPSCNSERALGSLGS